MIFIQGVIGQGNGQITDDGIFQAVPEIQNPLNFVSGNQNVVIVDIPMDNGPGKAVKQGLGNGGKVKKGLF